MKNAYIAKQKAIHDARLSQELQIHCQVACDAAMIAANEVLGLGAGRAKAFYTAYCQTYNEIISVMCEDTADLEYTAEVVDRRLKPICGELFQPWKVRYGTVTVKQKKG